MRRWRPAYRMRNDDTGVSLVELLVAIAIGSVVSLAILTFVVGVNRSSRFTESSTLTLDESRRATDRIQQEIREATQVSATADPLRLVLQVDVDGDGTEETVTYVVEPMVGEFRRSIGAGPQAVIAVGVDPATTTAFVYDVAPPNTSEVSVQLDLLPRGNGSGVSQSLRMTVRLRNG